MAGEIPALHLLTPLQFLFVCESITTSSWEAKIQSDSQIFSLRRLVPLDPAYIQLRLPLWRYLSKVNLRGYLSKADAFIKQRAPSPSF